MERESTVPHSERDSEWDIGGAVEKIVTPTPRTSPSEK